ncbi:MAG: alpha/beta hydrolase [Lachnospiraceae bacterium]|nr:alpha/beta hydrolase [Lachnospiraceae bacterium]
MNTVIDGLNINYKITGDGPETVVMLQGWGTTLNIYDSVAKYFGDGFKFVQFDFPGFGGSDEPAEPWNVDAYTDFFCKFTEALGIKKASLLGHSYGGRVIIKLANRDNLPFEIDRIVLIDSAGILPKKTLSQKFRIRKYKILKHLFNNKVFYALFPELAEDWKSRQGSADYRNASPIMRRNLVLAVNEDLTALLPGIKQETLLVWGDLDKDTPIGDAHIMKEKIPSSGLAVLKGAGHYSFLEKPVEFKGILQSFFEIGVKE